jgi:hypothetical protein
LSRAAGLALTPKGKIAAYSPQARLAWTQAIG